MFRSANKFWEFGAGRMVLATLAAHSVSISIGISQGYSAILLPQLQNDEENANLNDLTTDQLSWIAADVMELAEAVSLELLPVKSKLLYEKENDTFETWCSQKNIQASLGAITNPIGSVLSGILAEYFGRRRSIQISSLPFLLGWVCLALAQDVNWLYAGRLITGIAGGMSTACYTYVSEISIPEKRGILQSIGPICASFGILLTYVLGYLFKWHIVAYISIAFSIISVIAMQLLPESPGYLLRKNMLSEGFDVLLWLRRSNALAQQDLDRFTENQKANNTESGNSKNIYLAPQTVKPFCYLVVLFLLQEFSGIYTLLFYAVNIFEDANLGVDEYIASIIVGVTRFIMALFAAILINRYGRKILCTLSSLGMALTMLVVAIYVKYYELHPDEDKIITYLPLAGVILNVVFCMVGMLPIPWIMVGEMFPLEARSIMTGVVICLAQLFIFICVKIYNTMNDHIQFSGTLLTFVATSVVSILFCKFILPETKNKTLEEIEAEFRNKKTIEVSGVDNQAFKGDNEEIFTVRVN